MLCSSWPAVATRGCPVPSLLMALLLAVIGGDMMWSASAVSVPYVVELTSGNHLEHQTQASTGQTTGVWLVHFYSKECSTCKAINAMLDKLTKSEDLNAIIANINCDNSPDVAARFGITSFPHILLFKNQQMYEFPSAEHVAVDSLHSFVSSAEEYLEGLPVPPPTTLLGDIIETLSEFLAENPSVVRMAAAGLALAIGSTLLLLAFPRGKIGKEE